MSKELKQITDFIRQTFTRQKKEKAVIAVSGGIDSAVSLTLAVKALGAENVFPLFLPYDKQLFIDSEIISAWNDIPIENTQTTNIHSMVQAIAKTLGAEEQLSLGNIMARVRMIAVYERARQLDALVIGTENKSEKYLGYFTRFGDEASDLEPLQHLYKTQVRELAEFLELPKIFSQKAPTAGLWQGQTDEEELGFSYEVADKVLIELIDKKITAKNIVIPDITPELVQKVAKRVASQRFKLEVPYTIISQK
ncbi:MAG: NAD+ synthase [Candidatus Pacebacteria bacterium]|nr:NAD+ synthase [Candidatus Paceibacterota bacterium]